MDEKQVLITMKPPQYYTSSLGFPSLMVPLGLEGLHERQKRQPQFGDGIFHKAGATAEKG